MSSGYEGFLAIQYGRLWISFCGWFQSVENGYFDFSQGEDDSSSDEEDLNKQLDIEET